MSTSYTILSSWPSSRKKNYQSWWKFDKVVTKTVVTVFYRDMVHIQLDSFTQLHSYDQSSSWFSTSQFCAEYFL